MDSKDARESLESGARCRCSNRRRTATAVLVIQSFLTAVCAAFSISIFLFLNQRPGPSKLHSDRGIYMQMIKPDLDDLRFHVIWNETVVLSDERLVKLPCGGPYMVYLWACVRSYSTEAVANMTMEQGSKSFHLETLRDSECKEMQTVIMLSEQSEVTLKVGHIKDTIKIVSLILGLHYMLGDQCFPSPLSDER